MKDDDPAPDMEVPRAGRPQRAGGHGPVAYVLGGGGVRGAVEVGMLEALLEAGITPDLVLGSSIGAINGAIVAADPSLAVVDRLIKAWTSPQARAVYGDGWRRQLRRLASSGTHLNSPDPLRELLEEALGTDVTFEDLAVPFRVVAANIERAAEHWFTSGPVIPAVLASASVPGLLPPTTIDGEHFIDGGIVNSIPIEAAVQAGARTIYVLQVGRVEEDLSSPENPLDTFRVAFEIARRHRFSRDMRLLPENVTLHMLPSGGAIEGDEKLNAYRDMTRTRRRIERAYAATRQYLRAL